MAEARGVEATFELVVGSEAVAFHGVPRYSLDFDVFVNPTRGNLARLLAALEEFGVAGVRGRLDPEVWARSRQMMRVGEPPFEIDLLIRLGDVEFWEAARTAVTASYGATPVRYLGYDALIRSKRAAGRPKDLADIDMLQKGRDPAP
jgi:hypothetical protein